MSTRMKIGVILDGVGGTNSGWRRPHVPVTASIDINHYISEARFAERAKLDFIFIADTLAIAENSSPHFLNRLEPLTMLGAVAAATSRIGLVATLSTSYTEPFTVARQLASLDLISDGRAGWNVVTSGIDGAALNHSKDKPHGIEDRYRRAIEHVDVVRGLWDSWEDDAFVRNRKSGVFFHKEKMHRLGHKGEFFRVDGPLNIARSRQGHPVLFQAGASEGGRDLAARTADAIFGVVRSMEEAREYSEDVKARAAKYGRRAEDIVFLPSINVIVAETEEAVRRKFEDATSFVTYEEAIDWVSFFFSGHDFKQYDPDAPFPDLGTLGQNQYRSVTDTIKKMAHEQGLTLREVATKFWMPRTEFVGTAEVVADACERWYRSGACDGFMLGCSATTFHDFCTFVLPILQARGLFHRDYDGETFRENLELPFVPNRYSDVPDAARDRRDMPLSTSLG
ncbi:LLM class flavin-dependent oxidoreductase [Paraburkholderia sp.]|uniref:LLM class flavin-dependent oxidoreductase n=1 Tax=Paraburkholderia sp. TaxID=1926495 RepID=UPI003C7C982F